MPAIHHLSYNCVDMARVEEFYTRFLGFRRVHTFNPGAPDEFAMLRLGAACIELFPGATGHPTDSAEGKAGIGHLAFEVEDIAAKRDELLAAGVEAGEIIDCNEHVEGLFVCFLKDPEGNVVELMQGWKDD